MPHELNQNIIGAFMDKGATTNLLFYMGIPVWFIQDIRESTSTRVERVVKLVNSIRQLLLIRGMNTWVDILHA